MSTPPMFLSRARLRHDVPAAALRAVLAPSGESVRAATTHQLLWTLFADSPDRERDFLWREAEPGLFYCLSARPPEDRHGLFAIDPPKPFDPALASGDRLQFSLRVNATVSRGGEGPKDGRAGRRGKPHDIVMDALHRVPASERASMRKRVLTKVAHEWLARQGEKHGFALSPVSSVLDDVNESEQSESVRVQGYRVLSIGRERGARPMRAGVLDLEGTLVVVDPPRLLAAVRQGFGRAKAFGCGLMLLRRVR